MNLTAIVLLAATAVIGAVLWYVVDRHRGRVTTAASIWAAGVPLLLLGAAAVFALRGSPASSGMLYTAHAVAVAAAVPGGWLLANMVLDLAARSPRTDHAPDVQEPESGTTEDHAQTGTVPMPPPPPTMPGALPSTPVPGPQAPTMTPPLEPDIASHAVSDPTTLRGGTTIGALERVAVVVTLLAGWPEGLALTLAVKGFGRYPELRRPSAPERFIIGTFASILWAVGVAGIVVALRS